MPACGRADPLQRSGRAWAEAMIAGCESPEDPEQAAIGTADKRWPHCKDERQGAGAEGTSHGEDLAMCDQRNRSLSRLIRAEAPLVPFYVQDAEPTGPPGGVLRWEDDVSTGLPSTFEVLLHVLDDDADAMSDGPLGHRRRLIVARPEHDRGT